MSTKKGVFSFPSQHSGDAATKYTHIVIADTVYAAAILLAETRFEEKVGKAEAAHKAEFEEHIKNCPNCAEAAKLAEEKKAAESPELAAIRAERKALGQRSDILGVALGYLERPVTRVKDADEGATDQVVAINFAEKEGEKAQVEGETVH
jgi:hypothetical protein